MKKKQLYISILFIFTGTIVFAQNSDYDSLQNCLQKATANSTKSRLFLKIGDIVYLTNDGFEDQFGGPNRKKFFAKNIKSLLLANHHQPMDIQRKILENTLNEWIGNEEQTDDITILGIKF